MIAGGAAIAAGSETDSPDDDPPGMTADMPALTTSNGNPEPVVGPKATAEAPPALTEASQPPTIPISPFDNEPPRGGESTPTTKTPTTWQLRGSITEDRDKIAAPAPHQRGIVGWFHGPHGRTADSSPGYFSWRAGTAEDTMKATWPLRIKCEQQGAALWVDGEDTGLITPLDLKLVGLAGDEFQLRLLWQDEVLHEAELVLDIFMERVWPAASQQNDEQQFVPDDDAPVDDSD